MLNPDTQIIAEVKTKSPFGFRSSKSWAELFQLANQVGDIVSIHTDPRWGGSFELVKKAKSLTKKPILAKGIHSSDQEIEKALKTGATWVLVVGRLPSPQYRRHCWIEPLTLDELKSLPSETKAVWNSRDLKTGGLKTETFADVWRVWGGWLCQASNIRTIDDVDPSADAILVGTHLIEFTKSLGK